MKPCRCEVGRLAGLGFWRTIIAPMDLIFDLLFPRTWRDNSGSGRCQSSLPLVLYYSD